MKKVRSSLVGVLLVAGLLLGVACGKGSGRATKDGGARATGAGGADAGGMAEVGAGGRGQTCSTSNGSCRCFDQADAGPAVPCDTVSVATRVGDVGVCCRGFGCRCDAYTCRNVPALGYCDCGASNVAAGGEVVTACPLPTGSQRCCYSPELNECTCSTLACDNGRMQVATCSLARVMLCPDGDRPVDTCSGGSVTGAGGHNGVGGTAGAVGSIGGAGSGGTRADASDGPGADLRDGGGSDAAVDGSPDAPDSAPTSIFRWVRAGTSAMPSLSTVAHDVAALAGGDVVMLAHYSGDVTFGQGELNQTTLSSPTSGDEGLLARYRADGSFVRATRIPGCSGRAGHAIATADGGFVITGGSYGSVTLGLGEPRETTLNDLLGFGFVARYAADGTLTWARTLPQSPDAVLALPTGAVLVAGAFGFSFTFGAGTANATTVTPSSLAGMAGSSDLFVARYEAGGDFTWIFSGGSPSAQFATGASATGLSLLGSDRVLVSGTFQQTLTLQPGKTGSPVLIAGGPQDVLLLKLATDLGTLASYTSLSATGGLYLPRSAAFADGSFALAAQFFGLMTFGFGAPNETTLADGGHFVAWFGADGAFRRVEPIVRIDSGDDPTINLARLLAAPSGATYLLGDLRRGFTFSPGRPEAVSLFTGPSAFFIARYDADGHLAALRHGIDVNSPGGPNATTLAGAALTSADAAPVMVGNYGAVTGFDTPTGTTFFTPGLYVARANP